MEDDNKQPHKRQESVGSLPHKAASQHDTTRSGGEGAIKSIVNKAVVIGTAKNSSSTCPAWRTSSAWALLLLVGGTLLFLATAVVATAAVASSSPSASTPSVITLHVLERIRSRLGFAWAQSPSQQQEVQEEEKEDKHKHEHEREQEHDQRQDEAALPSSAFATTTPRRIGQGAGESHQYAIVIDGGSTGSRMFVYRFFYPGHGAKREIDCLSNKKVIPGLSALDGRPEQAAEYMRPLFEHAATVVPETYQRETLVFIQATAGMRLLSEESQEAIYDGLYMDLTQNKGRKEEGEGEFLFPFRLYRKNIGTLSGRLEGFYAALSVNYLTGRIDTHLERERSSEEPREEAEEVEVTVEASSASSRKGGATQTLVGALDLGGSSTQIVFQHMEDSGAALDQSDFWVQSYLAYGVDTIRYRLWSHLTRHLAPMDPAVVAGAAVENPCAFSGHEEWFKGHRLVGTGEAGLCGKEIRRMLWDEEHERCTPHAPCGLDGVRHPPLTGQFLAMSVFFFALDCMKQLGPFDLPHWPSPSIDEIETAASKFCAQAWGSLNTSSTNHAFTRDDLLPYRCAEVVYIHTLLKHGYGFPGDSRDVTFVLDIEGMEVEWTLGFALSEVPLDQEEVEKGTAATLPHHHVYLDEADREEEKEHAVVEERRRREGEGGKEGRHVKAAVVAESEAEARDKQQEHGGAGGSKLAQGEPPRWGNGWQSLNFDLSEVHRLASAWQQQARGGGGTAGGITWTWWDLGVCALTTAGASVLVALVLVFLRGDREWLLSSPMPSPPGSPKQELKR